ncbi:hypothetical protein B0E46_16660 [Rhodanobacter sp. B04]|nr:hypothetical protein B0E46_16660 [Rhodanobacter sp. B04]
MSSLQKRAWLALWSMCPAYCIYFVAQIGLPYLQPTMLERIGCLAVVASFHAVAYICGLLVIKRHEAGDPLLQDERDRAIDGRATRTAYFILLTGMIVVGMVMPFNNGGWELVNAALFFIVLTETARYALILLGYRQPRLAR